MTERDVESQTPTLDSTGSTRFYSCCELNRRQLALHKKERSSHSHLASAGWSRGVWSSENRLNGFEILTWRSSPG